MTSVAWASISIENEGPRLWAVRKAPQTLLIGERERGTESTPQPPLRLRSTV
jgi:hypothetical protein